MSDLIAAAAAAGYSTLTDPAVGVDPAAARLLTADEHALGVAVAGDVVLVLTDQIPSPARFADLEAATGMAVTVTVTTPEILQHARARALGGTPGQPSLVLGAVLAAAEAAAASDVLLTVGRRPAVRAGGAIKDLPDFTQLSAADLTAARAWLLGEGRDCRTVTAGSSRWRIRLATTGGHPSLALRRLPAAPVRAEDLSLPIPLIQAAGAKHGLVLIASPAGGGRSTTAAAVIDRVNATRPAHIVTVSAPLEFIHRSREAVVTALEVGTDVHSAAEGVRLAGEIAADVVELDVRDAHDARSALEAALSGHLVVATVAAVSTENALRHLVSLLPPQERTWALEALAATLQVATAQQLVKTSSGALGAVFEVLTATAAARSEIRTDRLGMLAALIENGSGEALSSMDRSLALLVAAGRIHHGTAQAASRDQEQFEQHLAVTASHAGARTTSAQPSPAGAAAPRVPAPGRRTAPAPGSVALGQEAPADVAPRRATLRQTLS